MPRYRLSTSFMLRASVYPYAMNSSKLHFCCDMLILCTSVILTEPA